MLKWNERQISLCDVFLVCFSPFLFISVCHLRILSGTLLDFRAFIMFEGELRSISCIFFCHGKSFIGTNVLQSQARENSWKINTVKYTVLSCSNLQGFIAFKLSMTLKQLERFPLFGLTVASWTKLIHDATEAKSVHFISSHIIWLTLFCGHRFLCLIQQTTWEVSHHSGERARQGTWTEVYLVLPKTEQTSRDIKTRKIPYLVVIKSYF